MAFYEARLVHEILADDDPKSKKVIAVERQVPLLSRQFVGRVRAKKDWGDILWTLPAQRARDAADAKDGKQPESELEAPKWDVAAENDLVQVKADLKMVNKAVKTLTTYMEELLKFRNAERLTAFKAGLDEFVAKYLSSQEQLDQFGVELFFGNSSNAQAPVFALKLEAETKTNPADDDSDRTFFCFFKDALVTLAYCEPTVSYDLKTETEPKTKSITGVRPGAPVLAYSTAETDGKEDVLDILWALPIEGDAKCIDESRAKFAAANNLVRIDDADQKMAVKAIQQFSEFAKDFVEFTASKERWEAVSKALAEFSSSYLATQESWSNANGELYFVNDPDARVPVVSVTLTSSTDKKPVFCFFKDVLVKGD